MPGDRSKSTTTPGTSATTETTPALGTPSNEVSVDERNAARTFERLVGSLDRQGGHSMETDITGWVESWSKEGTICLLFTAELVSQ